MIVNKCEINRNKIVFRRQFVKAIHNLTFTVYYSHVECSTKCAMVGVREFIKLVCSRAKCHACVSVAIPYGTQKKCCCTGSLAQVRASTRDEPLDKVNGNVVPRTHCFVLEALLETLRTREKCLFLLFFTLLLNSEAPREARQWSTMGK